jgi:hypothetical protein
MDAAAGAGVAFGLLFVVIAIGVAILTIVQIIDCLKSEFTGSNKVIWILVLLFLGPLGAILYISVGKKQKIKPGVAYAQSAVTQAE